MSPTKVIIAGGGIAGPVLAMFLKQKGYDPIVYERTDEPTTWGTSLSLQPNGLRVLNLLPGLLDSIVRARFDTGIEYSAVPGDEGELLRFPIPFFAACGFGAEGVRRPAFHRALLVALEQREAGVTVRFAGGETDEASFAVGCDGLHSNTRACLFGEEKATFTGLTHTGGVSPIPEKYSQGNMPIINLYGDGMHMISYPIGDSRVMWALTRREPEAKETWREMDEEHKAELKTGPYSKLPFGFGELIQTSEKILKYGLYDRPALESWHKGRVVLVGDAAHPTSPHLGQGANLAFEDIYHLVRLLVKHNPAGDGPSTAVLSAAFAEYEQLRIPRTAALVKAARELGDAVRVVDGFDACKRRNDGVRAGKLGTAGGAPGGKSVEEMKALRVPWLVQPFEDGKSEI